MDLPCNTISIKQEQVIEGYLPEAEQRECVNGKRQYQFHHLNGQAKQESTETEVNLSNEGFEIRIKSEDIKLELLGHEQLDIKDEPMSENDLEEFYSCPVCNYKTAGKYRFKQHVNIHEAQKRFQCYECEFATVRKSNLRVHMNVHIREELFKCEQCEYRTIWKQYLRKHAKSHTAEKPFKCEVCDYRTRWKHNMPVHRASHVGKKPFKCGQCGYKVVNQKQLVHHMKSH